MKNTAMRGGAAVLLTAAFLTLSGIGALSAQAAPVVDGLVKTSTVSGYSTFTACNSARTTRVWSLGTRIVGQGACYWHPGSGYGYTITYR